MTYLIIINVIICLVLIATLVMHSNSYSDNDKRIVAIHSLLSGVSQNSNLVAESVANIQKNSEESSDYLNQVRDTLRDFKEETKTDLKDVNSKLEEIRDEVSQIRGIGYGGNNLQDVYKELERISGTMSGRDSTQDILDRLEEIDRTLNEKLNDNGSFDIIDALKKIENGIDVQNQIAIDKLNKGI